MFFNINFMGSVEVGVDIEKRLRVYNGVYMKLNKVKMEKVEILKCFMFDMILYGVCFVFVKSLLRWCFWILIFVGLFVFC